MSAYITTTNINTTFAANGPEIARTILSFTANGESTRTEGKTMYEQLVKRLRAVTDGSHEDKCDGCPYDEDYPCCVDCLDTMHKQAADAIDELNLIAESNRRSMEAWAAESARAHDMMPRWIPVTERFPQPYEDVNLQFSTNQAVGFWDGYCWGVYSGDGFYTEVADNEGKPTHWCKKLPEPPKEEDNG